MELYEQILLEAGSGVTLFQSVDCAQLVELKCYQAIQRIRQILANEELEDSECFCRIERIVDALEDIGVDAGGRHDFG